MTGVWASGHASAEPGVPRGATDRNSLALTYGAPAKPDRWEEESLPIGNGALGASVFGGIDSDELLLNEKTLWTGGPGVPGYRNGNFPEDSAHAWRRDLAQVQAAISSGGAMSPEEVAELLGQPRHGFGSYQSFGKLEFNHSHEAGEVTRYKRTLDLQRSLVLVEYAVGDTFFSREYFASFVDGVVAVRFSSSHSEKVTFTTAYNRNADASAPTEHEGLAGASITAHGHGRIVVAGTLQDNALQYNAQTRIITDGGTMHVEGEALCVSGANSVTLVWSAGTNYQLSHPGYRSGEGPKELGDRVGAVVDTASLQGFESLRAAHEADYKAIFDRVTLDLDGAAQPHHTDTALSRYGGSGAQDRALEETYYQFGRYLLISSSRQGSLPANLQGVWNNRNNPPWGSDYHVNVNLQMNYWPALSSNLGETTGPYLEYITHLAEAGAESVGSLFGFRRGWMVMNATNPFGFTGVHDWPTAFWFPEANAWLAQAFLWQWLYDHDVDFLRHAAWPVLKGAADFWVDYLRVDERDGTLVANPSHSPEHGPFTAGAAMSQQVAEELFESTITAARVLGLDEEVIHISTALAHLDSGLRVAPDSLLEEWKTAGVGGEHGHRHVSHLYALFPGRAVSPRRTPELAAAAEASLRDRGDSGAGWSMAWKVNLWAHLLAGDHAHAVLRDLIRDSTHPNLWDIHPPFQIDGNFGATSGINEMLVQNEVGRVHVLPALPSAWAGRGSFDGIRAWNNVTVGATWVSGAVTEIRIVSGSDARVSVASAMADVGACITSAEGVPVDCVIVEDLIVFDAVAGVRYLLRPAGAEWLPVRDAGA